MSQIASIEQRRFGKAEKALLDAGDYPSLEIAWAGHCGGFDEKSAAYRSLLAIYQDKAAQFAVEAFKYVRA